MSLLRERTRTWIMRISQTETDEKISVTEKREYDEKERRRYGENSYWSHWLRRPYRHADG